jgi:hypothetical protein
MIDKVTIELSYLSVRRRRQVVGQPTEILRFLKVNKIDGACFKRNQCDSKITCLPNRSAEAQCPASRYVFHHNLITFLCS